MVQSFSKESGYEKSAKRDKECHGGLSLKKAGPIPEIGHKKEH